MKKEVRPDDGYRASFSSEDDRLRAEIAVLRRFVTDRRWERMLSVLRERTRFVTVAVEDIYQPHNASAVLRSCDAFGIQDVHIIENRNRYTVNPGVELGTSQWLTMNRYRREDSDPPTAATERCIAALRSAGYRIVATSPHRDDVTPAEISLRQGPIALLFGTEKEGLTETALSSADEYLRIPMVGFVESLNISVSAAVTLQILTARLRIEEEDAPVWAISDDHRDRILLRWLYQSVRHSKGIIHRELGAG